MPAHNGAQVGKGPRHWDIGDVSVPNLILPIDGEITQKVELFAMRFVREGLSGRVQRAGSSWWNLPL